MERVAPTGLMTGKKGLVMGIANDRSIAWGIAESLHRHGAELAFSYQGETFAKRMRPLAAGIGVDFVVPCDVEDQHSVEAAFAELDKRWGRLDFVVHAIAYSDKGELKGRYLDTSRANFLRTLDISCFSFTSVARRAAALMSGGGSLLTLTFSGSTRVVPSYNVMGVAKAALEASVRYLAVDLGEQAIRVNALSAGPMRTLAGAAIGDARYVYRWTRDNAPLRRAVAMSDVAGAALYLLSDLSAGVTGEIHFVDCGYNVVGIASPKPVREADDVD